MAKISRLKAAQIARRVCSDKFDKVQEEYKKEERRLADRCWMEFYGEDKPALDKVRKIFLHMYCGLNVNAGGHHLYLELGEYRPIPNGGNTPAVKSRELIDEIRKLIGNRDATKEERARLQREVETAVYAAGTYKKLAISWPEGLSYYSKELMPEPESRSLAIPFSKINEAIGLGKDKEERVS